MQDSNRRTTIGFLEINILLIISRVIRTYKVISSSLIIIGIRHSRFRTISKKKIS